jgi:hypothetical protein
LRAQLENALLGVDRIRVGSVEIRCFCTHRRSLELDSNKSH